MRKRTYTIRLELREAPWFYDDPKTPTTFAPHQIERGFSAHRTIRGALQELEYNAIQALRKLAEAFEETLQMEESFDTSPEEKG